MFLQHSVLPHRGARVLTLLAGVAMTAAACGGSSSGGGGTQSVGTSSGSGTKAAVVTTHSGPDGAYLTDGSGRTLYLFGKDTGTTSTCSGDCAKEWPPFTSSGDPTSKGSATASMLGTSGGSGAAQVTYNGHPLYYFADDESPGDMNGQGLNDFGGLWTAVTPDGSALTTSQPSSSPSDSSGSSSEWG